VKRAVLYFLNYFFRFIFWFRYKVTIKGLEKLNSKSLNKPGGTIFCPNHPAVFIDPALVTMSVFPKYVIRPMIVEYFYFTPVVHGLMKFLDALPVPNFETSSNSLKRKRGEKVIEEVIKGVKKGDNFLIYPAGRLKHTAFEDVGGASGVHTIVQNAPEANIVLIRTKGLWGSSFSRALTGKVPSLFGTIFEGVKHVLKNLIFFTPRRHITIELEPAPADFPWTANRIEFNRWLERWYNTPDGITPQSGAYPGDSLYLVSYSRWKEEFPSIWIPKEKNEGQIQLEGISELVQKKVLTKLSELTEMNESQLLPEMNLAIDLGLDSLDTSELASFLQDQFDLPPVPPSELTTVARVLGIASKQVEIKENEVQEEEVQVENWKHKGPKVRTYVAHGNTMPEVFLHNTERMDNQMAIADLRSGNLTYSRLKLGVILLACYIRTLPGKYIGIMLPASVGSTVAILATQMAGKVPLMINWTQGPRHLEQVLSLSKAEVVLSSWAFLEKLEGVDLDGVDEKLVMLETVKRNFSLKDKLKALYHSKLSTPKILKYFGIDEQTKDDPAVLLFTSGTEAAPKGVLLSHNNVLSNQRAALEAVELYSDDVIFGILPPFHVFGFSVSGLIGVMSGIRTVYSPNPTDGKAMVKAFERWSATVMLGAPVFIKALLSTARAEQLRTLRLCITGAEKAPPELFEAMGRIGKEQALIEGYGITETSPILTANRPGKPRKGVGSPLPGIEILIVHQETLEPLTVGERGLILASGPNVFNGYINPGLASPFVTIDGKKWYKTGDLGFLDEEGRLTISGRLKRFVKIGGEMISLPAIEETLLSVASAYKWPSLEEGPILAVSGVEQTGEKTKLVLFTRFKTDLDAVNKILRDSGYSNLVRVNEIIQVLEIPIMGTGKINYRLLESEYLKK
jgi:long-chain-fatty-acid--[acyl-carrier-protein] ligase